MTLLTSQKSSIRLHPWLILVLIILPVFLFGSTPLINQISCTSALQPVTSSQYQPSFTPYSPPQGTIAFVSIATSPPSLQILTATNTAPQRLTALQERGARPVWSPDGQSIAYRTYNGETDAHFLDQISVFTIDITSGVEQHIAHDGQFGFAWSPDSTQLMVQRRMEELYRVDRQGRHINPPLLLTTHASHPFAPQWSPDGTRIAFIGYPKDRDARGSILQLFTIRPDGTDQQVVVDHLGGPFSWSPNGRYLAFQHRDNLYVVNQDGTCLRQLTHEPIKWDTSFIEQGPIWSPNGDRIVFVSRRDGNSEIYSIHTDGSGLVNLTQNPAGDWDPSWSPDGAYLVFSSNRGTNAESNRDMFYISQPDKDHIYIMRADGTETQLLVEGGIFPIWSPKQ